MIDPRMTRLAEVLGEDLPLASCREHRLDHIDGRKQPIDEIAADLDAGLPDLVQYIFDDVSELAEFVHLYGRGRAFQRVSGPENLVDRVPLRRIVLEHEDIAFQELDLSLSFSEEVLQQFFVVGIKVVAH